MNNIQIDISLNELYSLMYEGGDVDPLVKGQKKIVSLKFS